MKILITGGAGYLGSVITKHFLDLGHRVTVLDNLIFKQTSPLNFTYNENYKFVYGDVRNKRLLDALVKNNDVIIPLAAVVGFPACKADPSLAREVNFDQIVNIINYGSSDQLILFPNTKNAQRNLR